MLLQCYGSGCFTVLSSFLGLSVSLAVHVGVAAFSYFVPGDWMVFITLRNVGVSNCGFGALVLYVPLLSSPQFLCLQFVSVFATSQSSFLNWSLCRDRVITFLYLATYAILLEWMTFKPLKNASSSVSQWFFLTC